MSASQAAISGSLYDASATNCLTGRVQPATPIDALGHYSPTNPQGDTSNPPYMDGTWDYCAHWADFYNKEDYAVGDATRFPFASAGESAWEYSNEHFRPWSPNPVFTYDEQNRVFKVNDRPLDPRVPSDRFLIFSTAAQSWGQTIGAAPVGPFNTPSNARLLLKLSLDLKDGAVDQTLHYDHYQHDGQFMFAISRHWIYWDLLLSKLGISHNIWIGTNP